MYTRFRLGGFFAVAKEDVLGILPLVGPAILSSLTDVEEKSLALESRAFSHPGRRHLLWAMGDRTWERAVRWLLFLGLVVVAVARVVGIVRG